MASSLSYRIRRISFFNQVVPIMMQNENGPCPLLALANVLLLRQSIRIHPDVAEVTHDYLVELVGNHLIHSNPPPADETLAQNQQAAIEASLRILPRLAVGLDVNVRFNSPTEFEFTEELTLFDIFGVSLVHGWVMDPQDRPTVEALSSLSYNQAVEKVVSSSNAESDLSSSSDDALTQVHVIKQFFEDTASQLTYYGLVQLHSTVKERELCVFFRNNHFSTLFKIRGELYILCTDIGFLYESDAVWEKLNEIDGDVDFVDCNFKVLASESSAATSEPAPAHNFSSSSAPAFTSTSHGVPSAHTTVPNISPDFLSFAPTAPVVPADRSRREQEDADLALAMRLQADLLRETQVVSDRRPPASYEQPYLPYEQPRPDVSPTGTSRNASSNDQQFRHHNDPRKRYEHSAQILGSLHEERRIRGRGSYSEAQNYQNAYTESQPRPPQKGKKGKKDCCIQ
eukprot:GILI01019639.1.p1 GENE.GILI01019639.1~~GILI01019639.1.p1  ORF type:complete len:475 (-),score=29.46 GILI01019639.1:31-1398(-)